MTKRTITYEISNNTNVSISNMEGIKYLNKKIPDNSINLILTDPPYIISKKTGMDDFYNKIKHNDENNIEYVKNDEEWNDYKLKNNIGDDIQKEKYLKYGSIYGKKYSIKTMYGDWDLNFTIENLDEFVRLYYNKLCDGGTLIIFFDIWKITLLRTIMEKYNFKQIRLIEWIKTNAQPRNSRVNYLSNCKEYAVLGIKGSKPTFNSKYDNGLYYYPLQGGNIRTHPTQKSLKLFEDLIKKHSNENDIVLDTFLGSGTTLYACINVDRNFKGCEISDEYFNIIENTMDKTY